MPDFEPLSFSSRDVVSDKDDVDVKTVCSGRRRPRVWLRSPSACLSSALHHVQELKTIIESWIHKSGNEPQPRDGRLVSQSEELAVQGFSLSASYRHEAVGFMDTQSSWPLWKRIQDVLDEVVHLVERLEADRQEAHEALSKERRRRALLEDSLHNISLKSEREHSSAIHREREVCVRDVGELKLHLNLERQKVEEVQQSLSHTETVHQALDSEVHFRHTQILILREHLDSERGRIAVIQTQLKEAEAVWRERQTQLSLIKEDFKEMDSKICEEKRDFETTLLVKKNGLENQAGDFSQLKQLEEGLRAERSAAEGLISLVKESRALISRRIPEVIEQTKATEQQISTLRLRVEGEMKSNREFKETLFSLQDAVDKKKLEGEDRVSHAKEQLQAKQKLSEVFGRENLQQKQCLLDYEAKLVDSGSAVKQMNEEKAQMIQKITNNAEQWEKAKAEASQAAAQHGVTRAVLEEQERRSFTEEQDTQRRIESLRKDLTAQTMSQHLLKNQCVQMSEELKKLETTLAQTNAELHKDFEGVSAAAKALETKMEEKLMLTKGLDMFECDHRQTLSCMEKQRKEQQDQLRAAQEQEQTLGKSSVQTESRITGVVKRTEEYRSSSADVLTTVEKMPGVISGLQKSLNVLKDKHQVTASLISSVQSQIDTSQQHTRRLRWICSHHRTAQTKQVQSAQNALNAALKENRVLASSYTDLQGVLQAARHDLVTVLSHKNHVQDTFQYFFKLSVLQRTMHGVLVDLFNHQNHVGVSEVHRYQNLRQENSMKIESVQFELSRKFFHFHRPHHLEKNSQISDEGGSDRRLPDAESVPSPFMKYSTN